MKCSPELVHGLLVRHEPELLGQGRPHVGKMFLVTNYQDLGQGIPAVDYPLSNTLLLSEQTIPYLALIALKAAKLAVPAPMRR